MKSKAIFVALLALAFTARAARVSQSEAAGAASVWAGAGKALGVRLGATVESVREYSVTNGCSFYAVKLDGGTVIMTSDTALEPIVAFSPRGDLDFSADGPLFNLLSRDILLRSALAGASAQRSAATSAATSAAAPASSPSSSLWSALLRRRSVSVRSSPSPSLSASDSESAPPLKSISDVRVAPLVKSQWSQSNARGQKCYNYYTPNNYVCGCTATAMSQIMRYHEWPQAEVEPRTYECKVDGTPTDLTMEGGAYDWANMTLVPEDEETLTIVNRQAIGKLTSDAGIALKSAYSAVGTDAYPRDVAAAFRDAFGYPDAICYWNESGWSEGKGGLHTREVRDRIVYANLDAGQPVQFAIYGYQAGHVGESAYWAGHAVVADGYGFMTIEGVETEYVHVNMGWAGTDDMWYNIPEINAANSGAHVGDSGYDFLYLGGAIFNISTADTGLSILSGRLTDEDGVAVEGATVSAFDADGAKVGEAVSDANGIYYFKLPGDAKYSLGAVSADGLCIAEIDSVFLPATTGLSDTYVVEVSSNVGNSWGNDMELDYPSVRVGDEVFASVDSGIAKARELAETAVEPPVVEIIHKTRLKRTQTIDFNCVLLATNATPAATPVVRLSDAQLVVASGTTLVMSNIVFAAGSGTLVEVKADGYLAVSGVVDFGVDYETAAVRTATANGFWLLGGLLSGFVLDCAEAQEAGDVFGYAVADETATFEAIRDSTVRIANFYDPVGELRGQLKGESSVYSLVWRDQAVPFEDSVGYFVDSAGEPRTAARIDRLFDLYKDALAKGDLGDVRRMVLRKGGSLSRPLAVEDGLSLVGEDVAVSLEPTAGFTVTGGELAISGIAFSGYKGNAFFLVNGEDAALSLGTGTALSDFEGTNKWSGAVTVLKGSASASGATFDGCRATGQYSAIRMPVSSYGGAFYIAPGCSLSLKDSTISDCYALNYGGAVYAATNSTVELAGELHIAGSTQGAKVASDIFLSYASNGKGRATLLVAEAISGEAGVRWQRSGATADDFGNTNGLLAAEAASAAVAHGSSGVLFSNATTPALVAVPDDNAVALRWTESPTGPQPWEGDPDDASARVEYDDGTEVYYLLVSEAFEAVDGDATIWVQGWDGLSITGTVTIAHNITLASDTDVGAYWLDRRADSSILVGEGASLTLRDITLFGCEVTVTDTGDMVLGGDPTTKPLIDVQGGSLTLATPSEGFDTEITCVFGDGARNAGAVCVWKGGSFRMESGAAMRDCYNDYANEADGSGRGGALMVDDGTAVFAGGTVELCEAYTGGGVFIGNKGAVSISGDTIIDGNSDLDGDLSDLVVYDQGTLTLAGKFTGTVGYVEGVAGDAKVFGVVAGGVSAADALSSAHNFYHDWTGDVGMAVAGEGRTILVWSAALADDGKYIDDDGEEYQLVDGDAYGVPVPAAAAGLVYNGEEQFGVEEDIGYTATGNSAVAAGEYTATLTLRPGFKWEDGSTGAKTVAWSIAKATYDMSGVTFAGATFTYSKKYYELLIDGDLPDGVSVSYTNNRQCDVGEYVVTASFEGDYANYEEISDMTATLKIEAPVEPTPPGDDPPSPAQPKPIAFTAVAAADGSWTVSLTTAVERCWYTLYETDSLAGGFSPESATAVECRQATAADVPTMTFTIPAGAAQRFWRVVAEPEDAH